MAWMPNTLRYPTVLTHRYMMYHGFHILCGICAAYCPIYSIYCISFIYLFLSLVTATITKASVRNEIAGSMKRHFSQQFQRLWP